MESILIVEDEFDIRENLQELLESEGYYVYTAKDGNEGYNEAVAHKPDIILSDIRMPVLDGIQLLIKLQENIDTATIPVIFLSAKIEMSDIREGMLSGADDYITKPFKSEEVLRAITARLKKKRNYQNIIENLRVSFIKNVPHELRTPLISILGFSELVEKDLETLTQEEIKEIAQIINKSGKRLHRRIEKLIQYGILLSMDVNKNNDKNIIKLQNDYLTAVFSQKANEFGRADDLKIYLENCSLPVEENLFLLMITELLENSFKFSNQGSPVTITGKTNNGNFILLVEDNGIGIDIKRIEEADILNKLDRQLENREGMGVGLAIVKRIADMFKIDVCIDAETNKYTRIQLTIPRI